jgi:hypothetical protein
MLMSFIACKRWHQARSSRLYNSGTGPVGLGLFAVLLIAVLSGGWYDGEGTH